MRRKPTVRKLTVVGETGPRAHCISAAYITEQHVTYFGVCPRSNACSFV